MNCPCLDCPAANPSARLTAAQIRRADAQLARKRLIHDAATRIAANLSWGAAGPPWAKGADAAKADRAKDAAQVVALGKDAADELRAEVKRMTGK